MGKVGGFMEFSRKEPGYRPVAERLKDFKAVETTLDARELNRQAARCMNCGVPFCHGAGCPLGNLIPEWNEAVYRRDWEYALELLCSTSSFPEFTARICPAPCEAACVCEFSDEQPVSIRQIELAIIEYGFDNGLVKPRPPESRTGRKAAVVGSGPAGLTVADVLNKLGHEVTVFDEWPKPGGILRYGIPEFKLEKWVVDRRIRLMEAEGVRFECGVSVGVDLSKRFISDRFDAVCLTGGAREPRDLTIPGRRLDGIHFAMDFLTRQNCKLDGEVIEPGEGIVATDRDVLVIGGGDTGSDCVGTALRQGARSVVQVEIMPKPPEKRSLATPWPMWPDKLRSSSSHEEGGRRLWAKSVVEFVGDATTRLSAAKCLDVAWKEAEGRRRFELIPGSESLLEVDLALVALGFIGPGENPIADQLGLKRDARGNIRVDEGYATSQPGVFAAGDMAGGQSLVVRAIADGRKCAGHIHNHLTGR